MAPAQPSRRRGPSLPPHEFRLALLAAFFSFAPVGFFIQIVTQRPGNWLMGIIAAIVSGFIAVAWAATFIYGRFWWLAIIVPLQAGLPPLLFTVLAHLGLARPIPEGHALIHRIQLSAGVVICIVLGYVILHKFVGVKERRLERAQAELDMAAQIHKTLVPPLNLRTAHLEVFGVSRASSEMGGDLLDAVVSGPRIDLCVADVSGHGVKAGVVMGLVKGALRMRLRSPGELADLARDLSEILAANIEPGMFVTAAWLRFEPGRAAIAVITGHPPVFQFLAATGEVIRHDNEALPLGIIADDQVQNRTIAAAPGDVFLAYTDGIAEVSDARGRQFGYERIADLFKAHAARPLAEIEHAIAADVAAHGVQLDDQTILLARVL